MEIKFHSKTLKRIATSEKLCKKQYGELSKVIHKKVLMLRNINNVRELRHLSGHFHELKYQAKGVYAVTLKHPYRLILKVEDNYIAILDITNYHDHTKRILSYNN